MAIAKLSIDLEARLAGLQAGLDKAGFIAEKTADRITKRFDGVNKLLGGLGAGIGASLTATGIVAFFRATTEGLDKLNDLSDATGASVENLSALEDIAVRTGTSMDTAADAVVKLNKALADAKPGSDQAAAFKALGLSVEELKRLDPVDALQKLAVALQGFASDGNKARVVQELFGKSLREVAPLLKEMAESGKLNATVTKEQADAAEKFNKQISSLQKNVVDLSRSIAGPLIAAANEFFDVLQGKGAGQINSVLAVPMQAVTVLAGNVAFVLKGIGVEIGGIAAQAAAVARLDFSGAGRIGEMMREDAKAARADFEAWQRRILALGTAPQASYSNEGRNYGGAPKALPILPSLPNKPIGTPKTKEVKPPWDEAQWLRDAQQDIDRLFIDLNASGQEAQRVDQERRVKAVEEMTDDILAANQRLTVELVEDDKARAKALILLDQAQLTKKLNSLEVYGKAYEDAQAAIEEQTKLALRKVDEVKEEGDNVGKQLGLVFSSAAGDAIRQFEDLRSVLKGVLQDIAQIAFQQLVTKPLETAITKAFDGFSFASLLMSAKGNVFNSSGVVPFASGGVVRKPTMFGFSGGTGVMGEAGPEAILPLKRGSNGQLGVVGGGGVTVNQTINVGAGVSRNEVAAAMAVAKRSAVAEIYDAQRRGRMAPA